MKGTHLVRVTKSQGGLPLPLRGVNAETLHLTEPLAFGTNVIGELVGHPRRVLADHLDVIGTETALLAELSPRSVERQLADVDAALWELPGARNIAAFESEHLPV